VTFAHVERLCGKWNFKRRRRPFPLAFFYHAGIRTAVVNGFKSGKILLVVKGEKIGTTIELVGAFP